MAEFLLSAANPGAQHSNALGAGQRRAAGGRQRADGAVGLPAAQVRVVHQQRPAGPGPNALAAARQTAQVGPLTAEATLLLLHAYLIREASLQYAYQHPPRCRRWC